MIQMTNWEAAIYMAKILSEMPRYVQPDPKYVQDLQERIHDFLMCTVEVPKTKEHDK